MIKTNQTDIHAGTMLDYGGGSLPVKFLACDGSAVSRSTYSLLFVAIGVNYGSGDGSTTFNLPDSRGAAVIGAGTGTYSGASPRTLGQFVGEENHTLTQNELASHTHNVFDAGHDHATDVNTGTGTPAIVNNNTVLVSGNRNAGVRTSTDSSNIQQTTIGGNVAHNTMQPSLVATKMIKY